MKRYDPFCRASDMFFFDKLFFNMDKRIHAICIGRIRAAEKGAREQVLVRGHTTWSLHTSTKYARRAVTGSLSLLRLCYVFFIFVYLSSSNLLFAMTLIRLKTAVAPCLNCGQDPSQLSTSASNNAVSIVAILQDQA